MNFFGRLAAASVVSLSAAVVAMPASAVTWDIIEVLSGGSVGGPNGGNVSSYGASSFHDASGTNVMSGGNLGNIQLGAGSGVFGTYDDALGVFDATFSLTSMGGNFDVDANNFNFGVDGILAAASWMAVDFDSPPSGLFDTSIGFKSAALGCCDGNGNGPNSFLSNGTTSGGVNLAIMTLWGADGFDQLMSGMFGYSGSAIGMDLRLRLRERPALPPQVPVPPALPLFGTGVVLLGILGWRKKRNAA